MSRFEERLASGTPIVADGGMGAVLSSAVPDLRCPEEANLRAPESVLEVHLDYIRAGAELIETNSFGANRAKLGQRFLAAELEQINAAAVRIAREAREVSGRDVFIAGSVGPLGDVELRGHDPAELFAEQARVLEGRGVDLFVVETFYDLDELETAIAAIRSVSALPLVALLTFDAQGETLAGVKAEDAAARLRPLGLAAYGANHGAGPAAALAALARMGGDGAVLAALPNVGLASMTGKRIVFPHATPAYFEEFAAQARALGARLIGGCCGTTPAQIAAIREAVDANRRPAGSFLVRERKRATPFEPTAGETQLERMLRDDEFAISVQVDPPLGANPEALIETARAVRESGRAQFVDVNDNPRARARMSGIMASVAIERFTGLETIPHLTPRDSTIAGLESLLLGAHAEGVRNILAVTGDPPEAGDYPGTHAVYDVDSIGLVELIAKLNAGEDWHGRTIDAPTTFFPGVAVNPTADDLELEADRFHRKVDAGARYAMTQILFDLEALDAFRERLGGSWPIPILVGVWPIRTTETLVRVHNEVPGIVVPDDVQERYRVAGAGARDVGLALGRELIEGARERASGVYVVAPFRRPLDVVELLPEPAA
ncbi:MAG TPA: bifunctional homocysteine S-methyltransferase/methylenetetrahydrofolate reductase [Gaiellaceae bacterium]|jgi:methionine synthase / methylenetetrahydrofolate reductase(NADPH)|nr:bifunctional homocysteine S-methyltransferase/methylenetetrahydrofolate reductase [Gaiellaceae bacterium]